MNRKKGILTAGTLTGLVLITILVLGFRNLQAKSDETEVVVPSAEVDAPQTKDLAADEALQAWQDYSIRLEQAVLTLQARDAAYRQQLDAANQTILQLQDQINSAPAPGSSREHEEHEQAEHEGFELEGFDD